MDEQKINNKQQIPAYKGDRVVHFEIADDEFTNVFVRPYQPTTDRLDDRLEVTRHCVEHNGKMWFSIENCFQVSGRASESNRNPVGSQSKVWTRNDRSDNKQEAESVSLEEDL